MASSNKTRGISVDALRSRFLTCFPFPEGLGRALRHLMENTVSGKHSLWGAEQSQELMFTTCPQGRITKVYADNAKFLGARRHTLVGGEFEHVFNGQTLSETDLGKLRRAYSWAHSGKVSVATLITYRTPYSAPRLMDTRIHPMLVDGQLAGIKVCARDLSALPDKCARY